MGHERVGCLPRTRRWRDVIAQIGPSVKSDIELARLADSTLENVRTRYERIYSDSGVQAAFGFLVALTTSKFEGGRGKAGPTIDLENDPSVLQLTSQLNSWVGSHAESLEYAELAKRAAADAIVLWTRSKLKQTNLFEVGESSAEIWSKASNGAGFCEVARLFFAKFTERYLKYFLEREASVNLPTLAKRNSFGDRLGQHIDLLSQHAFETSKITQSFAAGWFNNHTRKRRPTDRELRGFLTLAFGKLREELRREVAQ